MKILEKNLFGRALFKGSLAVFLIAVGFFLSIKSANAATLSLSPSAGTYAVGSTFDVSIFLDTEGESVNALEVDLSFPPDKLQLVSPKTSLSVIEIWTSQPKFNNQTGTVHLQGGVPNGINLNKALIATLTFRVRSVGNAIVKFQDRTKVLLNDGQGTDDLQQTTNAVYKIILPPPQGPIIASSTHPEQGVWYTTRDVSLNWATETPAAGYSYILDKYPTTIPDDISEGEQQAVSYSELSDGQYYFHIKARNNNAWGGVTHFAFAIDASPPADFGIDILPSKRTTSSNPIVEFSTTDQLSGIDHYELRTIPLSQQNLNDENGDQSFYFEAESPYILGSLEQGSYDITVRAYDNAGNYRESSERLSIVSGLLSFAARDGLIIRDLVTISWFWLILLMILIIVLLLIYIIRLKKKHAEIEEHIETKVLPGTVQSQLDELRKFRRRYGKMDNLMILLMLSVSLFFGGNAVFADDTQLDPPIIDAFSKTISNEEIFYMGGRTDVDFVDVVIYSQNTQTGETVAHTVRSDEHGEWFYRHDTFLSPGRYILWAQSQLGDEFSPPSAQVEMSVQETAFELGATRISYAVFGAAVSILLIIVIIGFVIYIMIHTYKLRRRKEHFLKEIREAEESVRRGFAVLRRDIQEELALVKKAPKGSLAEYEREEKERQLLKDLEDIEAKIGKEIWDIEEEVNR